jgi:hypothetical protein
MGFAPMHLYYPEELRREAVLADQFGYRSLLFITFRDETVGVLPTA